MKAFVVAAVAIGFLAIAATPALSDDTPAAPAATQTTTVADTAPAPQPETPPVKPPKPKKKCRSETELGSFIPKSTCHTQEEWDAIDAAQLKNAGEAADALKPTTNTGNGRN